MYLFNFALKIINLFIIIPSSMFGLNSYQEIENKVDDNLDLNEVTTFIEEYDTKIVYNSKIPSNIKKVLVEGKDKITYQVDENETKVLQESVTEVIEQGTGAYGEFTGTLTGYSADCGAGCSGEGYLACYTASKKKFSIKYDGIYYEDTEYGSVRILSAASQKFPCGTIVKVTKGTDSYYAVVMDRGGSMNSAWNKGIVHMDLAFNSNDDVKKSNLTGKNIQFSVQRWGW